ncbi:MAG: WD40 repeat domain-containing serine/threonine protein kinase [Fimbriiglobus sp.]
MICPTDDDLRLFLDAQAGAEGPAIESHLEECESCRQAIERLTLDPSLIPPPFQPTAISPFLEELKRSPPSPSLSPSDSARPEIPGYILSRVIGRGGMGVVYEAVQESLGRTVAVKVLADGPFAPAGLRERFRREGRVIARLHHLNVVRVIEVGEADGTPYLVLEYVAGRSLAEQLTGSPWAPRRAAEMVLTLAGAIHFAHEHGVIHRDLKPANVLLDGDTPKVADFGLAGFLSADTEPTTRHSHGILGTPEYAAPEQLGGSSRQTSIGPAADVYSLGAILYELLTGRPPFANANPVDTITQSLYADPISPARLERSIPRDIETVCLKCLEKQPQRRYATANELAEDLGRFITGAPVMARPVGQVEQAARWLRRHPVHLASLLASITLVLVCWLFLTLLLQSQVKQTDAERQARHTADARFISEEMGLRSATRRLIESDIDLKLALCEQGEVARGLEGLKAILGREDLPPELKRVIRHNIGGWGYRNATLLADLPFGAAVTRVGLTPDGAFLAATSAQEFTVWDTKTGERCYGPIRLRKPVVGMRIAPDGKMLVFGSAELMICVPVEDDFMVDTETYPADIADVSFAPDGGRFAVATTDGEVRLVSTKPSDVPKSWHISGTPTSVGFHPDGKGLFIGTRLGGVEAVTFTEARARTLATFPAEVRQVKVTHSGKHVAVALANDTIEILDATNGKSVSTTPLNPRRKLSKMILPPRADIIIGGCGDHQPNAPGECVGWSLPNGRRRQTLAFDGEVVDIAASEDGYHLLAGGGHRSASLWIGQPWRPSPIRLGDAGYVSSVALDRNGLTAAVAHLPGPRYARPNLACIRLWQLPVDQRTGFHFPFEGLSTFASATSAPTLVASDLTGNVVACNSNTGELLGPPLNLSIRVRSFAVHPAGEMALAVTDLSYHLIHLRTGNRQDFKSMNNYPKAAFSSTGDLFAVNSENETVEVYRTTQPEKPLRIFRHREFVVGIHFSPDDHRVALCGIDGIVSVWDLRSGAEVFRLPTGNPGHAIAFSPDGRRIAFAGRDRTLTLLDAETGTVTAKPIPTMEVINRLTWNTENHILANGVDGAVRLFDAETGRAVGPAFPVTASGSALSHTGDCVFIGEPGSGIRGWKLWKP